MNHVTLTYVSVCLSVHPVCCFLLKQRGSGAPVLVKRVLLRSASCSHDMLTCLLLGPELAS